MSTNTKAPNRYWRCKKCGGVSDIRANRCQNPRCCAILALTGEIVYPKSGPSQKTLLLIGAAIVICALLLYGAMWTTYSKPNQNVPLPTTPSADSVVTEAPTEQEATAAPQLSQAEASRQKTAQIMAATDSIGAGGVHTVVIRQDGTALSCGDRENHGACNVYGWNNLVAVSSGDFFTLGLFADGTVDAVGDNSEGQCNVDSWTDIVAIAAGDFHSIGLRQDGTVVAAGKRDDGQCNVSRLNARVNDDIRIIAVAASFNHTVVLYSDGTVDAVGSNLEGQCNTQSWTDVVAVYAGVKFTLGLRSDGTVLAVGENSDGRSDVSGWSDVAMISAGDFHTVAITTDGRILHTGQNQAGQRNLSGWNGADIVAIGAGCRHTVALTRDGTILAVGENKFYQCDLDGVNTG